MLDVSFKLYLLFGLTTLATLLLFHFATGRNRNVTGIVLLWMALQNFLALKGVYLDNMTAPPKIIVSIIPTFLAILVLFLTKKGKGFLDQLELRFLTLIHAVRIPVEICLYWLFLEKQIPELMTFEGRNFDIIMGLTAPIVYYFYFINKKLSNKTLIAWNVLGIGLLLNIVIHAILSVETPFQQLAFDQPNVAITYSVFILLPAFIVPAVFLSHFTAIRQLSKKKESNRS